MTRYTVSWRPEVLADLADLWSAATDRPAITAAADQIDELWRVVAENLPEFVFTWLARNRKRRSRNS
jgi:hypothetical protein